MKKSLIAGAGAAAFAFAALPFAGVFADTSTSNSFTDTLTVGVKGGCTLENSTAAPGDYSANDRTFTANIEAGNVGYLNATDATTPSTDQGTITVSCNTSESTKTWTVTVDVTNLTSGANSIIGGTATSGADSAWAIQSNATGTTASNPFATYAAAADGTFLSATADKTATFNPSYQVYVAPDQAPGTYTGTATYEITLANS